MIKAIIFDADNTLYKVRNEKAYDAMFSILEKETGKKAGALKRAWKEIVAGILNSGDRSLKSRSREYSLGLLLEKSGISDKMRAGKITDSALSAFWKEILLDLDSGNETKRALSALKEKYILAVASDEFRKYLELKLNRAFGDWRRYFKFVVSAEDAGELKPSENFSKRCLRLLKMEPSDVLFVGDSWERDLEPAKRLGLATVLVADEKNGAPDYFVKNIDELARLEF